METRDVQLVDNYVKVAESTDIMKPVGKDKYTLPLLGLAGEIGSLLTTLKKHFRDASPTTVFQQSASEELGDIIWYAVAVSRRNNLNFRRDVLLKNLERISDNPELYEPHLATNKNLKKIVSNKQNDLTETFSIYQKHAVMSAKFGSDMSGILQYLSRIWKNQGDLLGHMGAGTTKKHDAEKMRIAQILGDVMWYVAVFAKVLKVELDLVAQKNIEKALSIFPPEHDRVPTQLYDDKFSKLEQFPRVFDVIFCPSPANSCEAIMIINGLRIGDPLRDNTYQTAAVVEKENEPSTRNEREFERKRPSEIDGYRFHDSVHFALVAVLGWSPVMRGLMKRKRKSNHEVDDAEDGARAQIVEEMIVKLVHAYAVEISEDELLDDRKRNLSFDLLKQIRLLTKNLEVSGSRVGFDGIKYWEWNKAFLMGFRAFNKLRKFDKGRLRVDLHKRELTFYKLKKNEESNFSYITK